MAGDRPTLFATFTGYFYCLLILLTLVAVLSCAVWLLVPTTT